MIRKTDERKPVAVKVKFPAKRLWIRPIYLGNNLSSIALVKVSGPILCDEEIIEHFPADTSGKYIRGVAEELYPGVKVEWAAPLVN